MSEVLYAQMLYEDARRIAKVNGMRMGGLPLYNNGDTVTPEQNLSRVLAKIRYAPISQKGLVNYLRIHAEAVKTAVESLEASKLIVAEISAKGLTVYRIVK